MEIKSWDNCIQQAELLIEWWDQQSTQFKVHLQVHRSTWNLWNVRCSIYTALDCIQRNLSILFSSEMIHIVISNNTYLFTRSYHFIISMICGSQGNFCTLAKCLIYFQISHFHWTTNFHALRVIFLNFLTCHWFFLSPWNKSYGSEIAYSSVVKDCRCGEKIEKKLESNDKLLYGVPSAAQCNFQVNLTLQ